MLQEYAFNNINSDTSDVDLRPGEMRDALNVQHGADGVSDGPRVFPVKGNTEITRDFGFPAGTNICVGQVDDPENQRSFWFIYNSNGDHCLYELYLTSPQSSRIISGKRLLNAESSLELDITRPVHGSIIDDLLYWTDAGTEMKVVNVVDADSGSYTTSFDVAEIAVLKPPPLGPITTTIGTDATVDYNLVRGDYFQFCVRFVYVDGEKSLWSMLSTASLMDDTYDAGDSTNNYIDVSYDAGSEEVNRIQWIEYGYIKNGIGDLILWARKENPVANPNSERFFGNEFIEVVAPTEGIGIVSSNAPRLSSTTALHKNRLWSVKSTTNYDIGSYTATLGFSISDNAGGRGFRQGGSYKIGIIFKDKYGRSSGVQQIQKIDIPLEDFSARASLDSATRKRLDVYLNLTGAGGGGIATVPSWVEAVQYVRTKDLNSNRFCQVMANILWYVRDVSEGAAGTGEFEWNNRVYLKDPPGDWSTGTGTPSIRESYRNVHMQLPLNTPLSVDNQNFFCKMLYSGDAGAYSFLGKTEKILRVLDGGTTIEVGDFGTEDWASNIQALSQDWAFWPIELYDIPENTETDIFYTIGERASTPNQQVQQTIEMDGDAHVVTWSKRSGQQLILPSPADLTLETNPVFFLDDVGTLTTTIFYEEQNVFTFAGVGDSYQGQAPDYTKDRDRNTGQSYVEILNEGEINRGSTVVFSDTYVQDSNINGLSTFQTANEVTLDPRLGPVTRLIPAKEVLLAIHPRATSSIYVGEGFVESRNDNPFLAKTEGVVGDERRQGTTLGTEDPRSIVERDGLVYGFDRGEREAWRYSPAGLEPISTTYKIKQAIVDTMDDLFAFEANENTYIPFFPKREIIGGYDELKDEYVMSFHVYKKALDLPTGTHFISDSASAGASANSASDAGISQYLVWWQVSIGSGNVNITLQESGARVLKNNTESSVSSGLISFIPDTDDWSIDVTSVPTVTVVVYGLHKAKTFAFNEGKKAWTTRYSFNPEAYSRVNDTLVSFWEGIPWSHNTNNTRNNFYGAQFTSKVKFIANRDFQVPKLWKHIVQKAKSAWAMISAVNPYGQDTDILTSEFRETTQQQFYAEILRDKNTNADLFDGAGGQVAIRHGKEMRSNTLEIEMETTATDDNFLDMVAVGYDESPGELIDR